MTTKSKIINILIAVVSFSCSSEENDDAIPPATFQDIVINLNLPEYNALKTKGYQYISGGIRGIILYRINTSYYAFERNCSFQPNNACATVEIHASGLYFTDPCCGSTFNTIGEATSSPASRSLRKYATILKGDLLTVTDDVIP